MIVNKISWNKHRVEVYKASIISYFMPLVTSLFAFFMPDTNQTFNYIIISVFIFSIIIYPIALIVINKEKRQNAARFIISFNMLMFCFLFTVPLIKVAIDHVLLQMLLVLFYFLCIILAVFDQKSKNALVLPESGENRKLTYVFFAIPVVAMFLGGGGNIIIVRQMHNVLGDPFMFVWGPIILYVAGCWLTFLFSSLFYQGFTKNGMWIK